MGAGVETVAGPVGMGRARGQAFAGRQSGSSWPEPARSLRPAGIWKPICHRFNFTKTNDGSRVWRLLFGQPDGSTLLRQATTTAGARVAVKGQLCESLYYAA